MFRALKKLLYKDDKLDQIHKTSSSTAIENTANGNSNKKLIPSLDLQRNKKYLQGIFDKCSDIYFREINIMGDARYSAVCIYITNLAPQEIIEERVITSLVKAPNNYIFQSNIQVYCKSFLGLDNTDLVDDMNKIVDAIVDGELVLFINGFNSALTLNLKQPPGRSVTEPAAESVIRGPREGFTEIHGINITLIRKRIASPDLKTEMLKIGKQTKTNVTMLYLSNLANQKIVNEVRNRLNKIDIDSVLAASYIEEYIEDNPFSLFPTVFRTEKPDVAAGKILEGRVVLIVDSVPVVLSVPTMFSEFFMSPDDYYLRFYVATLSRWIRVISFSMSVALPSAFVSLVQYHQELLPTSLMISIVRARANIPFPPMFEAFFMLVTYLILQEADIRMPKTMGQAVSVVGGLVLGQAAISAGIVSAHMIIIVAFSAVAALAIPTPELQMPLSYIRFGLLLISGVGGAVGLTCGIIVLIMHLLSLRSFGTPYLAPFGPLKPSEIKDSLIRAPLWSMRKRPKTIMWKDSFRRKGRPLSTSITDQNKSDKKK